MLVVLVRGRSTTEEGEGPGPGISRVRTKFGAALTFLEVANVLNAMVGTNGVVLMFV